MTILVQIGHIDPCIESCENQRQKTDAKHTGMLAKSHYFLLKFIEAVGPQISPQLSLSVPRLGPEARIPGGSDNFVFVPSYDAMGSD